MHSKQAASRTHGVLDRITIMIILTGLARAARPRYHNLKYRLQSQMLIPKTSISGLCCSSRRDFNGHGNQVALISACQRKLSSDRFTASSLRAMTAPYTTSRPTDGTGVQLTSIKPYGFQLVLLKVSEGRLYAFMRRAQMQTGVSHLYGTLSPRKKQEFQAMHCCHLQLDAL
jgi:hypothetical protein